jgi:hypothetical protein
VHFFESDPSVESEEELWEVFEEIIRAPIKRTIYCVLDALDESEDEKTRQRLSRRMKRLLYDRNSRGKFSLTMKLLITSRPIVDINIELGDTYMELKARPEDLGIVIEGRVTELRHFPADLKNNVVEELIDRAGGTYLWVSIVLNEEDGLCCQKGGGVASSLTAANPPSRHSGAVETNTTRMSRRKCIAKR